MNDKKNNQNRIYDPANEVTTIWKETSAKILRFLHTVESLELSEEKIAADEYAKEAEAGLFRFPRSLFSMTNVFAAVAMVTLSAGCAVEDERAYDEWSDYDGEYESILNTEAGLFGVAGALSASHASMDGRLGERNVTGAAKAAYLDEDQYGEVEVLSETQRGAAMHLLYFEGGLHHEALVPGASLVFEEFSTSDEIDDLHIGVIGCEGANAYDWTYDQPAREVRVDVSEGEMPSEVRFDYEVVSSGTFGEEVSSGTFTIDREQ